MKFIAKHKLLLILLLAFAARFTGIWYGLPSLYNSDEPFNVVNALAFGAKKSLEPTYFVYPAFYSYLLAAAQGLCFLIGRLTSAFGSVLDFGASYFIDPTLIFFWGRFLSVVLGVATVWLIYQVGRRFFSERTGLFAALLLTLSSLHVDWSHWILLEATLTFMCTLTLFFIFVYHESGSNKHLLLASLVCGLAISTKYNAGFLLLPLWLTIIYSSRNKVQSLIQKAFMATATVVTGFILGSPYWLIAPGKYIHDLKYTVSHVSRGMAGHISSMPLVWPLWELIFNDLTIGLLCVAGVISVLFGGERRHYILLSFALPTLLVLGLWSRTGVQYIAPIFPALVILGAIFLGKIAQPNLPAIARNSLFAVLFLIPLIKISYTDFRLTQPDSRTQAKQWIEANLPAHTAIAYENYVYGPNLFDPGRFMRNDSESQVVPLEIREKLVEESFRRASYRLVNLRKDFKLKALRQPGSGEITAKDSYVRQLLSTRLPKLSSVLKAGVPYILTSSDNYARYFLGNAPPKNTAVWLNYQNGRHFYESVFKNQTLKLIKEFKSGRWNLGPVIRLYMTAP